MTLRGGRRESEYLKNIEYPSAKIFKKNNVLLLSRKTNKNELIENQIEFIEIYREKKSVIDRYRILISSSLRSDRLRRRKNETEKWGRRIRKKESNVSTHDDITNLRVLPSRRFLKHSDSLAVFLFPFRFVYPIIILNSNILDHLGIHSQETSLCYSL